MQQSLIFDIKKYAINDGPGIRLTVFFKGCPLSCIWCHNPEGKSKIKQKSYKQNKCIACCECLKVCEQNALFVKSNVVFTNFDTCTICENCIKTCPTNAMEIIGKAMSVANIMKIIKKENWLFDQSEGGVSFSGGEPLMHPQILIPLLNECGKEKIHRCVDTSGFAPTDLLLEVAQKTELFMFDLKMMDSEKHKKYTGVSNEIITYNLKKLAETGAKINIRIPLIKNVNDDDENIIESAKFIASLTGEKKLVHLLPYHNLVESKYEKLNQNNSFIKFSEPEPDRLKQIVEIYTANSIETKIYG